MPLLLVCRRTPNAAAAAAQVYGLPSIMLFKDGKLVDGSKREGAISKDKIISYLDTHGISK